MPATDPRVDAYIAGAAEFARPILGHLREVVHEAVPEVEETMKWSFPHFTYHGILCSMAAFKGHCAFTFWKPDLVFGEETPPGSGAMGHFGRIGSLQDLPSREVLLEYVRKAARLNREGVRTPRGAPRRRGEAPEMPARFRDALARHSRASASFERMSPSHRREYVEWIAEAKREDTRERRIATALEWIADGKPRHWKYEKRGNG